MITFPVHTPEQEVERARGAQQILDNEIFKEACVRIEEGLAAQRQRVPIRETDMHTKLIIVEQLWVQLRDYIQQVADTGKFAQDVITQRETREKTLLERVLSGQFRN
jgi:hypothetical protein